MSVDDNKILQKVEAALSEPVAQTPATEEASQEPPRSEQAYPIDGVSLAPAFSLLIDRITYVREQLLTMLNSVTDRDFVKQRKLMMEYQSLIRSFDILAGYVTPDGRLVTPIPSIDEQNELIRQNELIARSRHVSHAMSGHAARYRNTPIRPRPPMAEPQEDEQPLRLRDRLFSRRGR